MPWSAEIEQIVLKAWFDHVQAIYIFTLPFPLVVGHICGNCHQGRDINIIFYLDDYFLSEEHQSMLVTCHFSH